ncbi:uncharacterized protein LOC117141582 [Drosophila mauritiana]|uniref:Uncharacterized protein LOC117141582 n=1 Tax=Drosophila mauritiana TaxID=7226 RepID=A0A6P8KCP3_DROMA|nr:uncharacterized protein LOC117141582 [Drosophila mauritiana]
MQRQLLFLGFLLATLVKFSQAECNICSSESNVACVSKNKYQNCSANAIPTGTVYTCPNNTFCTGLPEKCTSNEAVASCNECRKCDGIIPFACTSPTTFALCNAVNEIASTEYPCSTGEVCLSQIGNPCVASPNGTSASCSYYALIDDLCIQKSSTGRFPYPNDLSCLKYVHCFRKGSTWSGNSWQCPSSKPFFSASTSTCVATKPATCA